MADNNDNWMRMMGLGTLGSGIGGLTGGGKNPFEGANKYLEQIPGATGKYLDPYSNAGTGALGNLQGQYNSLLGGPGKKLNEIGGDYQQSPGFKFALDQALGGAGRAAAAGGMAGSPMHEQTNMSTATGLANQDYNNWMNNALGLYGKGLSGSEGMANMGLQAGTSMADNIAQMLAQQGQMKFAGDASKNQSNPWGNVLGGAGMLAGSMFGGPMGGAAGNAAGSAAGNWLSNLFGG